MLDKISSLLSRLFFVFAMALLIVAFWDRLIRLFGWSISGFYYDPGRIFEFAAMMMVFVIALLLRQIREQLKSK